MELEQNFEVAGLFKLEALRADGSTRLLADWFPNLILNQGLDMLATQTLFGSFSQCGSGSTPPAVSDTQLVARIAGQYMDSNPISQINTTERYLFVNSVYTYAIGQATGNISELGIGAAASGTTLFSRALVKDASGNVTTVTVLADEQLRITYQLRVYQPTADFFNASLGGYQVVGRSANVGTVNSNVGWYLNLLSHFTQQDNRIIFGVPTNGLARLYTGVIGPITGTPAGEFYALGASSGVASEYVSGTFRRDLTIIVSTDKGNDPAGIGAICVCCGPTFFQFGFTPNIMKTNLQELKFTIRYSWSRRIL
jgi:hypothetical protein